MTVTHVPALYGASVNCFGNSSCDDYTCMEAFVSYPVLNVFVCKRDNRNARTVRLASVELAQARPNYVQINDSKSLYWDLSSCVF